MLGNRAWSSLLAASIVALVAGCSSNSKSSHDGAVTQLSFATPEDAVTALVNAAATEDKKYSRELFGPEIDELSSGDPAVDSFERKLFVLAIQRRHDLRANADGTMDILVGENSVPFPVPLEEFNGRWMFNTLEGVERMADLRVGYHELKTIELLRVVPWAQDVYFSVDRDGDGVLEYAQRFKSTDGLHDGLYWETTEFEPDSPLGPFAAKADAPISKSLGYQGYFFKVLTSQTANAPGGARSYMSGNNLVSGYAVLAYPAIYGETAIMTFQMSDEGIIYQKDLGSATPDVVQTINAFDPTDSWTVTED